MVLQPRIKKENRIFLAREWLSVLIFAVLGMAGALYGRMPLLALAAFIVITMFRSDTPDAFCWSLVLIPNIRLLDDLGAEFIVNIMMALPILVYLFRQGTKRLPLIALVGSMILFMMELIHDAVLEDMENFVNIAGWTLNICLCMLVTLDPRVKLNKNDVFSAFTTGIIMSAAIYLGSGQDTLTNIMDSLKYNLRFSAYANDPNYYSLYICMTMACVLNVKGYNIYKFIVLALLTAIGLLTASKMCLLLMLFTFALLFLQIFNRSRENRGNRKFLLWGTAGMVGLVIAAWDYIKVFIDNFIRRAGLGTNVSLDMGQLTSGRSWIMAEYMQILSTNIACLLFGYGFSYHEHLGQSDGAGAHNTYLDLLLAWGIIGVAVFVFVVCLWAKNYRISRNIRKLSAVKLIPLLVMLINFADLSCLSASMFPFVIAVAFIQWLPNATEQMEENMA